MGFVKEFDDRHKDSALWQFVKFNMVSFSAFVIQLVLVNTMPLVFDAIKTPLPEFLHGIFRPDGLDPKYVTDGAVTWGYVLPFFLSNFIANIYAYFVNMKATFRGKGGKYSLTVYMIVMIALILFTTWLQSAVADVLLRTSWAPLARTVAAMAAGAVQMAVIFPLEKFVLFKEKPE
ncbi:MAG: hypothetical protein II602_01345 [Erysipelotrichales bacterium]|nr:hypothetical protein [Erysipelotrichales bacterium]